MTSLLSVIVSAAGSNAAIAVLLFLTPYLQEDIAITGAALLVASHRFSAGWAFPSLFLGMVTRDMLIYGLGAAARRYGVARRLLIRPRVQRLGAWLGTNRLWILFAARITPGMMYPTYLAFGWFGLSFRRYALGTTALSLIYLPTVFALAYMAGSKTLEYIGGASWLALLVPGGVIVALLIARRLRLPAAAVRPFADPDAQHQGLTSVVGGYINERTIVHYRIPFDRDREGQGHESISDPGATPPGAGKTQ